MSTVVSTQEEGSRAVINCSEALGFYNQTKGGVDIHIWSKMLTLTISTGNPQSVCLNNFWVCWWLPLWMLIFLIKKIVLKKNQLEAFIVSHAELLISQGWTITKVKRESPKKGSGSIRSKTMLNVGDHMPVKTDHRRRCVLCSSMKKEKRSYYICSMCKEPLCFECFGKFHN